MMMRGFVALRAENLMRKVFGFILVVFAFTSAFGQNTCGDPEACNYTSGASGNEGCMYLTYPGAIQVCAGEEASLALEIQTVAGEETAVIPTGQSPQAPRVARLSDGTYYLAGVYVAPFAVGGISLPGSGSSDVYVAKFSSSGDLLWVATGGSNRAETLTGLSLHPDGGIALTVNHLNPVTWSGTGGTSAAVGFTASSNSNHHDGHVVRIGSSGNILWAAAINGGSNEGMNNVVCSDQGKVLVASGFNGCCPSYFNATINGPVNSAQVGSFGSNYGSGALISFGANGAIEWTNTQHARDTGLGPMDVDAEGNIYVSSGFRTWSPGTPFIYIDVTGVQRNLPNPGIGRAFVVKVNSSGFWQWGYSFGNAGYGAGAAIGVRGLELGPDGNVHIVGSYFADPVTFGSANSASLVLPSRTTEGGFLAIYSPTGGLVDAGNVWPNAGVTSWVNDLTWVDGEVWACGGFSGAAAGVSSQGASDGFFGRLELASWSVMELAVVGGGDTDDLATANSWASGPAFCGLAMAPLAVPAEASGVNGGFVFVRGTPAPPVPSVLWSDGFEGPVRSWVPTESGLLTFEVVSGGSSCSGSIEVTVAPLACGDPSASNYDPSAACPVVTPISCTYCGCTQPAACNFDAAAACDDGSCVFGSLSGCSDPSACNFDAGALACSSGGACVYPPAGAPDCAWGAAFCGPGTLWDPAAQTCIPDPATCAGGANPCPADITLDGVIGIDDLLELLSVYATLCPE